MTTWGKIIGGITGLTIGGPLGGLFGLAVGHAMDMGLFSVSFSTGAGVRRPGGDSSMHQTTFTVGIIALAAKLAKVDGVVSRAEIAAFKRLFQVAKGEEKKVAFIFNQARAESGGYEPYAFQIAHLFEPRSQVLEEVLASLFHIALADGALNQRELVFLRRVAGIFGFDSDDFRRIQAGFGFERQENRAVISDRVNPYQVLGLTPDVDNDTLRSTYRRLVREHHPDRLIAEGLPQGFIDQANERLGGINAAWDQIRAERKLR